MTESTPIRRRLAAAVAAGCAGLALASAANAVDLRDWGRKFAASERFVVLSQFNNEAVLDKETQLVWQRTPGSTYPGSAVVTWHDAHYGCSNANTGGRMGWRLPSAPEIQSLIDRTMSGSIRLPAGHPFTGVTAGDYWTGDQFVYKWMPRADAPTNAGVINLGSGSLYYPLIKDEKGKTWCVRGPA